MFLNSTVADDLKAMKQGLRIFLTMRVGRVVSLYIHRAWHSESKGRAITKYATTLGVLQLSSWLGKD
jgi:hypothetical protein